MFAWMRRLAPLLLLIPAAQVSARDDSLCEFAVARRTRMHLIQ